MPRAWSKPIHAQHPSWIHMRLVVSIEWWLERLNVTHTAAYLMSNTNLIIVVDFFPCTTYKQYHVLQLIQRWANRVSLSKLYKPNLGHILFFYLLELFSRYCHITWNKLASFRKTMTISPWSLKIFNMNWHGNPCLKSRHLGGLLWVQDQVELCERLCL